LLPVESTGSVTTSDFETASVTVFTKNTYPLSEETDDFGTTTDVPFEKATISHEISDIDDMGAITAIPTCHVANELVQNYTKEGEGESESTSDFIDSDEVSWIGARDSSYDHHEEDCHPEERLELEEEADVDHAETMMVGLRQSLRRGNDNFAHSERYEERYVSLALEKQLVVLIESRFDSLKGTFVEEVRMNLEEVEENFQRAADAVQFRLKNIRRESNRDLTRWMLPLEERVLDLQKQLTSVNDKLDMLLKRDMGGLDEKEPLQQQRQSPPCEGWDATTTTDRIVPGERRRSSDVNGAGVQLIQQQQLQPRISLKKDTDLRKDPQLLTPPVLTYNTKAKKKKQVKRKNLTNLLISATNSTSRIRGSH